MSYNSNSPHFELGPVQQPKNTAVKIFAACALNSSILPAIALLTNHYVQPIQRLHARLQNRLNHMTWYDSFSYHTLSTSFNPIDSRWLFLSVQ